MQTTYRLAGIDVHKKMLAVVIADVAEAGEFRFERRKFACGAEELSELVRWRSEREVKEAVMESTAQYWKPVWQALEDRMRLHLAQAWPEAQPNADLIPDKIDHASALWSQQSARRTEAGFHRRRTAGQAACGRGTDSEFRARARAALMAEADAWPSAADPGSCAPAEPAGRLSRRDPD